MEEEVVTKWRVPLSLLPTLPSSCHSLGEGQETAPPPQLPHPLLLSGTAPPLSTLPAGGGMPALLFLFHFLSDLLPFLALGMS